MKTKTFTSILLGAAMGAILFLYLYGTAVLVPTYDAWLLNGEDLNQHYLGWEFYRNSPWTFPVGLIQGLTVEPVSVIYTDSIPLLALIFKVLSPVLPETFQYFGVFGIGCFALQGVFGALIVRRFTENVAGIAAGTLFFVCSYVMFIRMYGHTALAANWLILAAFCIFLYRKQFAGKYTVVKLWTALFCVTVLTHIYFVPMVGAILFVQAMSDGVSDKDWKRTVLTFVIPIGAALAVLYCMGAFYGGVSAEGGGYGLYSSNLNTLFNPLQYSRFLPALPLAMSSQWEGSAYLGLGAMVLLAAACVCFFISVKKIRFHKCSILFTLIAVLGLGVMAVSYRITWGDRILAEIAMPGIWEKLGNIFRSGGRLMWPVMYLMIILGIAGVSLASDRWKWCSAAVLGLCALIQIADLSPLWLGVRNTDRGHETYETALVSPAWDAIADSGLKRMKVFTKYGSYDRMEAPVSFYYGLDDTFDLAEFALANGMTINDFYLSRRNGEVIEKDKVQAYQEISEGNSDADTLYVFLDVPNVLLKKKVLHLYEIDGFVIGLANGEILDGQDAEELSYGGPIRMLKEGRLHYSGAQLADGICWLDSQGVAETDDSSIPAGYYEVQVTGDHLENVELVLYDSNSGRALPLEIREQQSGQMTAYLRVQGNMDTLRLNLFNGGNEAAGVESAVLVPVG